MAMTRLRKTVLGAVIGLFVVWLALNFSRITADQDGFIRFVLGLFFAVLIMIRWKPTDKGGFLPDWTVPVGGMAGTLLVVLGIALRVHQFEWLGLILVLYACLRWALPPRFELDLVLALFLIYWIHPLPGQVFGSFQLAMQKLSVQSSEWVLHALNKRVWADGMTLRTGFRSFGVPESCSGMRTAVTVMLTTLGVVMLLRLTWLRGLVFVVLGIAQVLVLNVVRICGMVLWSTRMPPEWGETFLHDTLGVFLLFAIILIQAEVSIWKYRRNKRERIKEGIAKGTLERRVKTSRLPAVWRRGLAWGGVVLLVLLGVGFTAGLIYKNRPYHRRMMRRGTIPVLMKTDLEAAERVLNAQLEAAPQDRSMLSDLARVLVRRGKYDEALDTFDRIPGNLSTMENLLKSQALMGVERGDEAAAIVDNLPARWRRLPGVGILRAEYAVMQNEPELAGQNVVLAADSHIPMERVRALFPYLAVHGQWQAIVDSDDTEKPYVNPLNAVIAVHAHLSVNDTAGAADALSRAVVKWPKDVRFLDALSAVAVSRPGSEWEARFVESLEANVGKLGLDRLPAYIRQCFRLTRPDVAWRSYLRLRELDPEAPSVYMLPANFGARWFVFRRHRLGVKADERDETIDLRPLYLQTRGLAPFASMWELVPLAEELGSGDIKATQERFLKLALDELEERKQGGEFSREMYGTYAAALALAERYDEAHAALREMDQHYPGSPAESLLKHATFYEQQDAWQEEYEALREYFRVARRPTEQSYVMMVGTMVTLDMGVGAMEMLRRGRKAFPESAPLAVALAGVWQTYGFHEQALFILEGLELKEPPPMLAEVLFDSGRVAEAMRMSRVLGVDMRRAAAPNRSLILKPAEFSLARRWPEPLTETEMEDLAVSTADRLNDAESPYMRRMTELITEWYRRHGGAEVSSVELWAEAGRDPMEQAMALHRLAVLLARQERYEAATEAAVQAVQRLPESPILWRVLVALNGGDFETIARARQHCPADPEIWLAWIVARLKDGDEGPWLMQEIREAISRETFSVGTLVRAGHYLLRQGFVEEATRAARYAVDRADGLVPAYVLGVGCALERREWRWALECAYNGVEHAADPSPFYKTIVRVKQIVNATDSETLTALEYLQRRFPDQSEWAEDLGQAYFQQGDLKRALRVLAPLMVNEPDNVRLESMVLAAEAARIEGKTEDAVRILERAYKLYPDEVAVLNNLVYLLAQNKSTFPRARELLPRLLEKGSDQFAVLDTAAMVYLRNGQVALAREYMGKALSRIDNKDYSALEVKLNEAGLLYRMGAYEEAARKLEALRIQAADSPLVDYGAKALLEKVEDKLRRRAAGEQ